VPAGETAALAEALAELASDPEARHRMGRASRSMVEGYSPERWAEGMLRAVRSVAPRRPARKPSEPSP
jgi:glycosyltransferase involved in cell wall biosynthesis